MITRCRISIIGACLLLACGCAGPRSDRAGNRAPPDGAEPPASPEAVARLDALITGLGAADVLARAAPQRDLERWCMEASRPGAEAERLALCRAIATRLDGSTPPAARPWLIRALQHAGGRESAAALGRAMAHAEAEVRDAARRALLANSTNAATEILAAGGAQAEEAALPDLEAGLRSGDPGARSAAADNLLRSAEQRMRAGRNAAAARIYRLLLASDAGENITLAALCGLACMDAQQALPELARMVAGKGSEASPRARLAAVRIMEQMPEPAATRQLRDLMPHLDERLLVAVIEALAQRDDPEARRAVLAQLNAPQPAVSMAAIRAMTRLGGADDVPALAGCAPALDAAGRDVLVETLASMRGAAASQAMLALLDATETTPEACVCLIRALRARVFSAANAAFLAAARDKRAGVAPAAFEALAECWPADQASALTAAMLAATDDAARTAAESAVAEVCRRRAGDDDARCAPLLSALPAADGVGRASLVRVLGRVRGPAALGAIRAALRDGDAPVRDAAVRALAAWPDATVLADLKSLVKENRSAPERMLALRGCVRLLRQQNAGAESTLPGELRDLWDVAEGDAERRLLLGAMGEIGASEALNFAVAVCDQPALLNEAAAAVASIARRLAAREPRRARAALEALAVRPINEGAAGLVTGAREFIARHEGYVGEWMMAGPFMLDGADYRALCEHAFGPETFGQPGAWQYGGAGEPPKGWRPFAAPPTAENPWVFDLLPLGSAPNQCVYVGTYVWAESACRARLQIGSDDGVRVWLNEQLIHSSMAGRPVRMDEDIVPVDLRAGWNCLLLKITQYSGGWGFVCAVRAPDGSPLPGLVFAPFRGEADPEALGGGERR